MTHQSTTNRLVKIVSFAVSLLFVTFLVVGSSRAAFSDTTDNTANSISASSIQLVDDDSGSAMFTATGMKPGDTLTKCIQVTYNGDITPATPIKLYRNAAFTGTGLEDYLDLVIEIGTGGSSASCVGFTPSSTLSTGSRLADFESTYTNYASALSTAWTPTGAGQARTFRFSLALQDNNAAQGLNSTFGFTWEARS